MGARIQNLELRIKNESLVHKITYSTFQILNSSWFCAGSSVVISTQYFVVP